MFFNTKKSAKMRLMGMNGEVFSENIYLYIPKSLLLVWNLN